MKWRRRNELELIEAVRKEFQEKGRGVVYGLRDDAATDSLFILDEVNYGIGLFKRSGTMAP